MPKIYSIFSLAYLVHLVLAYLLRKVVYKIASKAIENKKLNTGIFSIFPVEGDRAVELARGYVRASILSFWFSVFFIPFIFIIAIFKGSV